MVAKPPVKSTRDFDPDDDQVDQGAEASATGCCQGTRYSVEVARKPVKQAGLMDSFDGDDDETNSARPAAGKRPASTVAKSPAKAPAKQARLVGLDGDDDDDDDEFDEDEKPARTAVATDAAQKKRQANSVPQAKRRR